MQSLKFFSTCVEDPAATAYVKIQSNFLRKARCHLIVASPLAMSALQSSNEKMMLRGVDPGYFQGCEDHVFWVDADTIAHTSTAQGVDAAKLKGKQYSSAAVEQTQQLRVSAEAERHKIKNENEE